MSASLSADYKEKIGLSCQFLIAPQQKEPGKHQYDYGEASKAHHKVSQASMLLQCCILCLLFPVDAMSLIGFLKHCGLDGDFKLKIEPNHTTLGGHDIVMASA